tara:strand:- start:206 stop:553 length:348 start_codon:yes stop_codon:yes gene_type:complete
MLYDYECDHCNRLLEDVYQSVKDDPLVNCPSCGEDTLTRVITGGAYAFVKNTGTIGGLADKNAIKNKSKINEIQAMKSESKPKSDKPDYHGDSTNKEISKMTPQQKDNYIMRGKK